MPKYLNSAEVERSINSKAELIKGKFVLTITSNYFVY